jgi:gamma-glutamyltranspeptidase/glutathione hydrolase
MPEAVSIAGAGAAPRYQVDGKHITAHVGREVSGGAVKPEWLDKRNGKRAKGLDGGRSVGVPTLMQMFEKPHTAGGRLDWLSLTRRAEQLSRGGFPVSAPAARALARLRVPLFGGVGRIFSGSGVNAPISGRPILNPDLASILQAIGRNGPSVLAGGIVGQSISASCRRRSASTCSTHFGGT